MNTNKNNHNSLNSSQTPQIGMSFAELESLDIPLPAQIINCLGPGHVGVINAVTNHGKTTNMRNVGVSVASGRRFAPFTLPGNPIAKVAYFDAEDEIACIRADIAKMASSLSPQERENLESNLYVSCHDMTGDGPFSLSRTEDFEKMVSWVKSTRAELVVIDTLTAAFSIRNENDNAEIQNGVMVPLRRLARECNAAVLATHHIGKSRSEGGNTIDAVHKFRGASSFVDRARLSINLIPNSRDSTISVIFTKNKGGDAVDTILRLNPETRWFEEVGPPRSTVENAMNALEFGRVYHTAEICELLKAEMSERHAYRSIQLACKERILRRVKHGQYVRTDKMTGN